MVKLSSNLAEQRLPDILLTAVGKFRIDDDTTFVAEVEKDVMLPSLLFEPYC